MGIDNFQSFPYIFQMEYWMNLGPLGFSNYNVSNFGGIKNVERNSKLSVKLHKETGYVRVALTKTDGGSDNEAVHILVILMFKGPPDDPRKTVDHINRIRHDNRPVNLRWATPEEQAANRDIGQIGSNGKGIKQLTLDGVLIKIWPSRKEAGRVLKLNPIEIGRSCERGEGLNKYAGYRWLNLDEEVLPGEIWKESENPAFEGYSFSSMGRVKTITGKFTYGTKGGGYRRLESSTSGTRVTTQIHRLICEAFLGPSPLEVNHKDGNKSNNIIHNLEYVTHEENMRHAWDSGLNTGFKRGVIQYSLDGIEIARYESIRQASLTTGIKSVDANLSGRIKHAGGFIWKYIENKN